MKEVWDHVDEPAVVVLGAPGAGKSTLLRRYELDNSQAALAGTDIGQHALTFFISLNHYRPVRSGEKLPLPADWLAEQWRQINPELPELDELLRHGKITLLLDALNEMPHAKDEALGLWRDFARTLTQSNSGNRAIFSCRSLDYSASLSSTAYPVPQLSIERLTDQQVEQFILKYCDEHGVTLWENLKNTPQLDLLRTPYYLKMLVEQTRDGEIPNGRAALFTGFVRQALRREAMNDSFKPGDLLTAREIQRLKMAPEWKTPFELPVRSLLIPSLSQLAFEMQQQRNSDEAAQVRIDYDDALDIIDNEQAVAIIDTGCALGVLEQDIPRDEVLYIHQLMQEYFAARILAESPQPEKVKQAWHVDQVKPTLQETLEELAISDPLPPLPGTGWEETTVLAAAMVDNADSFARNLMPHNLALAGRCASQPDVKVSEELKDELRQALVDRTQNKDADLRARIAAGLSLGELGDPRFARHSGPHGEYLLPPMIDISCGAYRIGSDDPDALDREKPMHEVDIESFLIAKFPVTNAEWALFIESGGYDDEQWWDNEAAKAWQRGETTTEGPKQDWRDRRAWIKRNYDTLDQVPNFTPEDIKDYRSYADMNDDEFESALENTFPSGRQNQPMHWNNDTYNHSSQPVVGISWFEARAYCAWLSAQTGNLFRLPTEVEWEVAARGSKGCLYAYGLHFDSAACNAFETHIRHTTPIGVFPTGHTPEGLVDMTGNTWDWTSSLYQDYPYQADDGRENPDDDSAWRVVRGGSWRNNSAGSRASYRDVYGSGVRFGSLGLRLVCSSSMKY